VDKKKAVKNTAIVVEEAEVEGAVIVVEEAKTKPRALDKRRAAQRAGRERYKIDPDGKRIELGGMVSVGDMIAEIREKSSPLRIVWREVARKLGRTWATREVWDKAFNDYMRRPTAGG